MSPISLNESYTHCRRLTRNAASSFYPSFFLLSRKRRRAMCALYAYLRYTDDLGDSDDSAEQRRTALGDWRDKLERALAGEQTDPLLPALVDTARYYDIPTEYLFTAIDGVEMDLGCCRYETFAELATYCYRVAAIVGLACIRIWGFSGDGALEPARKLGFAFQLTNILRDVPEDARRDRIYLPLEDLTTFGYSPDEFIQASLQQSGIDEQMRSLILFQLDRAEQFYADGLELEQYLNRGGRRALRVMTATYRALLDEIRHRDGDVFTERVRLGGWRKVCIVTGGLLSRRSAVARRSKKAVS